MSAYFGTIMAPSVADKACRWCRCKPSRPGAQLSECSGSQKNISQNVFLGNHCLDFASVSVSALYVRCSREDGLAAENCKERWAQIVALAGFFPCVCVCVWGGTEHLLASLRLSRLRIFLQIAIQLS